MCGLGSTSIEGTLASITHKMPEYTLSSTDVSIYRPIDLYVYGYASNDLPMYMPTSVFDDAHSHECVYVDVDVDEM